MADNRVRSPKDQPRCACGRYTLAQARFLTHVCAGQEFVPGGIKEKKEEAKCSPSY